MKELWLRVVKLLSSGNTGKNRTRIWTLVGLTSKDPLLYYAAPYVALRYSQDSLPKSEDKIQMTVEVLQKASNAL